MRKFAAEFIRGAYEVIAFFMFISTITVFLCVWCNFSKSMLNMEQGVNLKLNFRLLLFGISSVNDQLELFLSLYFF